MRNFGWLLVAALLLINTKYGGAKMQDGNRDDEKAIKALNETFAQGFVRKDPKLRASIFIQDATLVPPNAGFLSGRDTIEKHFQTEVGSVTENSKVTFSDYRFRFVKPDVAFVDTELTFDNVIGPDGKVHEGVRVSVALIAVRHGGKWFIQDERAHFEPMAPPK